MHGLDKSRLRRVHDVLSGSVERKGVPGLVALVSREDDVHVEVLGTLSTDQTGPMKRDTIFRIASITKPIAAVAAMILIVECKMRLEDPIERWIPELANRRVLRSLSSQNRRYCARAAPVEQRIGQEIFFGSYDSWGLGIGWTSRRSTSTGRQDDLDGTAATARRPTPIPQSK